jgi:hypothetical protein
MSSTDRQNRLLLAEDWKTIYQSFKYADFKSYDFDNLRRTMIEYLRTNYPEDFNDYIESSEYLALIDMIAFLGQNISFRIDLNARENFLELAERRESVLRLARLVSYNVTRNQAANGLLKFTGVKTTEQIIDSNGVNLANRNITWNDTTNSDWFEQFTKILNASLPINNRIGRPIKLENVDGIATEQYRLNNLTDKSSIFTFTKPINSKTLNFEIVSTGISAGDIVEEAPLPGSQFGFIYRDNGQGAGSSNTGFFAHFRQGNIQKGDFIVDSPVPNQKIEINISDINNSDVWLYKLNSDNIEEELWTKVDSVEGNNIVYNSISKNIRNIYSVLTRTQDRISLIFSDGIFGELPKGSFRVYYRTSANADYTITPASMQGISVRVPYLSKAGKTETLTISMDLKTPVDNASATESTDSIKTNAPSTYYTQNRLITAEDYNLGPLGISQEIIKTKSVNRTASGISRYYDILDATGKYSKTNIFGTDGVIYKEYLNKLTNFKFITRTDISKTIFNTIIPLLENIGTKNFYLNEYPNQDYSELNLRWEQSTSDTNRSTGRVYDENNIYYTVGSFTEGPLRFLETGALVKFIAPAGYAFLNDRLVLSSGVKGETSYLWTKVISTVGTGQELNTDGSGPITFNDIIPSNSILQFIKPRFVRDLISDVQTQIIDNVFAYRSFGLRYDRELRQWNIILQEDLDVNSNFSLGLAGDASGQQIDSSWLLLFETDGVSYNITHRTLRYVFESDAEVRFYFDGSKKIYDSKTGEIVKDKLRVLNINNNINAGQGTSPFTVDFDWEISKEYRDAGGYVDSKKVEVTFYDNDDDGIIDNPDLFNEIVDNTNYIFTKKSVINNNEFYVYVNHEVENIQTINVSESPNLLAENNPIFYFVADDVFKKLDSSNRSLTEVYNYNAYIGRDKIKFQYVHAADENSRIDPSSTNIIDTYILTKSYDTNFRQFINNIVATRPLPPSSDQLYKAYGAEINKVKSISDEVIYHPVKYKTLFGSNSDLDLQAVFKIVKNENRVVSDNEIKSKVITAINEYFALDNWDFGETFYFSELSSYIMKQLAPDVVSIVIVPRDASQNFGSLFEVKSENDEIFISSATVDDIELITANTQERLRAAGAIVTTAFSNNAGIQSSTTSSSTTTGGIIY